MDARRLILVEGSSDRIALEALARRRGRNLAAEGVAVVPIGGAQAIGRVLASLGRNVHVAALCDAGEEAAFRRGLERAGLGRVATRADMEALGFYVCVEDLEHELVRAVGAAEVERIAEAQGELSAFRTFQKQAAHRARPHEEQLWKWMHNRKQRYAQLLVDALELDRVPRPLDRVLTHA
jgi:hypothetical protein